MASPLKAKKAPPMQGINGVSIAVLAGGVIILISGLTNKRISEVIRGFLKGQAPEAQVVADTSTTVGDAGSVGSGGEHSGTSTGAGGTPSLNRAMGKLLAAPFGWAAGEQWTALDRLLTRESGWQNDIENPSSGAFGIGQALGHGVSGAGAMVHVRYPGGGTAYHMVNEYPNLLANSGNAQAQILWTYNYIRQRYGNPVNAWAHEEANSWY